tara:strand:+ start:1161 stop:1364 length:204 start_codon:yes stop_codon:yes gene_type:complete
MKKINIKFIDDYLDGVYPKGKVLLTSFNNAQNLISLGVAEEVKEEEKPKRGRKPKNKAELKDSIETK